jgi:lysophospholipid acyltransferase (LPLAT)-like uncharacterized protein
VLKRVLKREGVQAFLARLLGLYLLFVHRTARWQVLGLEHVHATLAGGGTGICAFWHENLPLMPELWRLAKRRDAAKGGAGRAVAHVLVSRHRDGRLIGEVIRRFDLTTVHASSSKGGAAGLLQLVRLLRAGEVVAITPDGPRGPHRVAAAGVAQLAALAGVPVFACAARASRGVALRSWDRMVVPAPFARIRLVVEPPVVVTRGAEAEGLATIQAALNAAQEAAGRGR